MLTEVRKDDNILNVAATRNVADDGVKRVIWVIYHELSDKNKLTDKA